MWEMAYYGHDAGREGYNNRIRWSPICTGFYKKVFSLMTAMQRGEKILSEGMMITVVNGPARLLFGSRRKEENDFVLGLELKPIQYDNLMIPTAEKKKSEVLMNCSKQSGISMQKPMQN